MADWPAMLVPAASVALGSLLTLAGQAMTNTQTRRREREARYDGFRIKRFEIERENLVELQELLEEHVAMFHDLLHHATTPLTGNHDVVKLVRRITMLAHRCLDDDVHTPVLKYAEASTTALAVPPNQRSTQVIQQLSDDVGELYGRAIGSVRTALRRDPFEFMP